MPYTPTVWTNGTTPVSATNMNHLETQYTQATTSFNQDLFTGFVLSGLVCTPDGVTLNQLDVTSGVSYLVQSDSTTSRTATAASTANQFLTSTINTTYYLFLLVGGTFQFSTTSTGPANSLAICQATTNASGNISAVTDKRPLNPSLLGGMAGGLAYPKATQLGSQAAVGSFGAPVIVAQTPAAGVTVTVTTLQTILSYTPTSAGIYRVSGYATQNGTVAGKITVAVNYTDLLGAGRASYFPIAGYVLANPLLASGAESALGPSTSNPLSPVTFYSTAAAISCQFQDPSGVPNDQVWFVIERLL